jgi:UDP-2-acetamido-3-amino-2,3-dideoxy-glucuronate N-acetyltransferase
VNERGLVLREDGARVHGTACIDEGVTLGPGTTIWHFTHVTSGARLGRDCMLGQGVYVGGAVVLGDRVRVQNNVSLYDGVIVEDDVFIGPSAVFTNVKNPRARSTRVRAFAPTRVCAGATLGANATVVCGTTVGRHAFVAAGAVVTRDVADHALLAGVPARQVGWVGERGVRLRAHAGARTFECPETGALYRASEDGLALSPARGD